MTQDKFSSPEMKHRLETVENQKANKIFNQILAKGVVIATTSDYRKKVFGKGGIGFEDVSGIPVDHVDEMSIKKKYESEHPFATENDPYRTKMVEAVARGKVEQLIADLEDDISYKDKVLIGLDTMPIYFGFDRDNDGNVSYRGDAIPKPTPIEHQTKDYDPKTGHIEIQADEMIEAELLYLLDMMQRKADELHRDNMIHSKNTIDRSVGVQVTTGLAIHVPGDTVDIRTFSISSFLKFGKLEKIAQIKNPKEKQKEVKDLVKKILDTYSQSDFVYKISGGINFADDVIKEILEITELRLNHSGDALPIDIQDDVMVEKGIYLGAPEKAIKKILQYIAQQLAKK